MIAGVVFCPQAPLLHPLLAPGAAGDLDALRQSCVRAVQQVLGPAGAADAVVVLAGGAPAGAPVARTPLPVAPAVGLPPGLARFGGPAVARTAGAHGDPAAALGGWLLATAGWVGPAQWLALPDDLTGDDAAAAGAALSADPRRLALLVLGDGSARRGVRAPRADHPDAEATDEAVASALARGDAAGLAALDVVADPARARELAVAGRAAWAVAAAAQAATGPAAGQLLASAAPYGVGYVVATWR